MLKHRLIPCLLLQNDGLVKTTQFKNAKYVGDPINALRIFNDKEVDEIMVLDIQASKNKKEPNYKLVEQFASECFMPLTYGGGINNVDQAKRLFNAGVEKICIQTAALHDISLVEKLAQKWGSSSILVSVDIKRNWLGKYKLYQASSGKFLDEPWLEFLQKAVNSGAGEIVLNDVDKDGMMSGMNTALIRQASSSINVPLVAIGGVGSLADIKAGVEAGASAISAGAFFVFQGPHKAILITYPKYDELLQLFN